MTDILPLKFQSSRISYCTISYWLQKVILLFLSYLPLSEFDAPTKERNDLKRPKTSKNDLTRPKK